MHPLLVRLMTALGATSTTPPPTFRRPSKRYGPGIYDTGPEAAHQLRFRRNLHPGNGSTLRKLQRILRVEAGLRPQRYPTERP